MASFILVLRNVDQQREHCHLFACLKDKTKQKTKVQVLSLQLLGCFPTEQLSYHANHIYLLTFFKQNRISGM